MALEIGAVRASGPAWEEAASVYAIEWSRYVPEVFISCAADWTIKAWHTDLPKPFLNIATHS
ncbi:unnamed protein product, partial [Dibothriocephalus latus]